MSSGATIPARAPASTVMLQTVMRPSIDSAEIVVPAYSMTCPLPPETPISPMIARITSLAYTPSPSDPSTLMRRVCGRRPSSVDVASTCSTSDVPMPNASAPKAPWVEV